MYGQLNNSLLFVIAGIVNPMVMAADCILMSQQRSRKATWRFTTCLDVTGDSVLTNLVYQSDFSKDLHGPGPTLSPGRLVLIAESLN